ncbi:uncharacterized protein METZ01_LOCUS351419 [marine metagenome]|uniref:Uncharacterized protein n=1 Tax=marine metagenome TaxID=408172 RepID=A0A382RN38_9ZZZZ
MTLPVHPDIETILENCVETMRSVILPELESEWGVFCGALLTASLTYANELMKSDRGAQYSEELSGALKSIQSTLESIPDLAFSEGRSPYQTATKALVYAQANPGPIADEISQVLQPVLMGQLEVELAATSPFMEGWGAARATRKIFGSAASKKSVTFEEED